MVTDTTNKILNYIKTKKQAKVVDLVRSIGITNAAIHRQLNKLILQEKIMKVGKPPTVFYLLKEKEKQSSVSIPSEAKQIIDKNYIYVSPKGEFLTGTDGFVRWVYSVSQEHYLLPLAQEYMKVRTNANTFINSYGWIDATIAKEQTIFGNNVLQNLLYKDFYSLEKFGKTQLGQMVLYAKLSQNIKIIEEIAKQIKPIVDRIILTHKIDTIAYIPPSIKRQVQLMTEMKLRLQIQLPEIVLVKVYTGDVIVSQKSLSKLQERIVNARDTIFIDVNKSARHSKNILIIDDAVGSGATMHETAKKIRELLKPTGNLIGFAIVGSMKGFEVIREI
jgi:hypoxanthine-guanine phosphoribosyltransferase